MYCSVAAALSSEVEDWDPVATDAQGRSQHFRELMTPAVVQEDETQIKCFWGDGYAFVGGLKWFMSLLICVLSKGYGFKIFSKNETKTFLLQKNISSYQIRNRGECSFIILPIREALGFKNWWLQLIYWRCSSVSNSIKN